MEKLERTIELQELIEKFLLPFGNEYMRQKYNWSPIYTGVALREYKRFMYLACISQEAVTPSLDIDEVWHTHILHTRSYREFSRMIGRIIHHDPGMPNERSSFQGQYQKTLDFYREVFGEEPPLAVWPRPLSPRRQGILSEAATRYEAL